MGPPLPLAPPASEWLSGLVALDIWTPCLFEHGPAPCAMACQQVSAEQRPPTALCSSVQAAENSSLQEVTTMSQRCAIHGDGIEEVAVLDFSIKMDF